MIVPNIDVSIPVKKEPSAERLTEDSIPVLVFLHHLTNRVADPHVTILNDLLICHAVLTKEVKLIPVNVHSMPCSSGTEPREQLNSTKISLGLE